MTRLWRGSPRAACQRSSSSCWWGLCWTAVSLHLCSNHRKLDCPCSASYRGPHEQWLASDTLNSTRLGPGQHASCVCVLPHCLGVLQGRTVLSTQKMLSTMRHVPAGLTESCDPACTSLTQTDPVPQACLPAHMCSLCSLPQQDYHRRLAAWHAPAELQAALIPCPCWVSQIAWSVAQPSSSSTLPPLSTMMATAFRAPTLADANSIAGCCEPRAVRRHCQLKGRTRCTRKAGRSLILAQTTICLTLLDALPLQGLIAFSRLGVYLRVPGVDVEAFEKSIKGGGLLGYIDALSGGSISKVGVFSLGKSPGASPVCLSGRHQSPAVEAASECPCAEYSPLF